MNTRMLSRGFRTFEALSKSVTARYSPSLRQDKPLTYEQANKPHHIAMRKGWNSMNTSNLNFIGPKNDRNPEGLDMRRSETTTEDLFIRRLLTGTWHNLFVSEIIIKRQGNLIRVSGIIQRKIQPRKMYFLIGYCEELLSYWLQCVVKLELQTVDDKKDVIFKYI